MRAYYNENAAYPASWLRNLVAAGLVPEGDVDERDIRDVTQGDLAGYTQCHFFAGIGLWPLALRMAGWPDDRPVWTGSCPCQPFSAAGKGAGFADERHLWPAWHWLISQSRPRVVFGEQVASQDGLGWLDLVSTDLEACGYACGPVVFPSCGIGAPNIRHRLWWVAAADRGQRDGLPGGAECERDRPPARWQQGDGQPQCGGASVRLADAAGSRWPIQHRDAGEQKTPGVGRDQPADRLGAGRHRKSQRSGDADGMGDPDHARLPHTEPYPLEPAGWRGEGRATEQSGGPFDPWRHLEWIACTDGRLRPIESRVQRLVTGHPTDLGRRGAYPLAQRQPGDVAKLRAYGNAINPVVAAEVISSYLDGLT